MSNRKTIKAQDFLGTKSDNIQFLGFTTMGIGILIFLTVTVFAQWHLIFGVLVLLCTIAFLLVYKKSIMFVFSLSRTYMYTFIGSAALWIVIGISFQISDPAIAIILIMCAVLVPILLVSNDRLVESIEQAINNNHNDST